VPNVAGAQAALNPSLADLPGVLPHLERGDPGRDAGSAMQQQGPVHFDPLGFSVEPG
jgi:hypothetical protein